MPQEEFTDAIMLLKHDHDEVQALFEKFTEASGKDQKSRLAQQICNELKIHMRIEEEIFYPAFRGKIEGSTENESYVEHDSAKVLVNDIASSDPSDDYFDAKMKVLREETNHHIKEEEKPKEGMFAQCRKTDVDLKALRDEMMKRKEELRKQVKAGGLPPAEIAVVQLQPA